MSPRDQQIARQLKREIAQIAQIIDFRVFGSRARGDAEEDSDLDVFIETETLDTVLEKKIRHIAWEVGFKYFIFIQTLVFTREEIEKSPLRASDIVLNIMEEGITV